MASLQLKAIAGPKAQARPALSALISALGDGVSGIEDATGQYLYGGPAGSASRTAVTLDGTAIGWVSGSEAGAEAMAGMLSFLASKEAERRALGAEVLHLYREVHLIEQLSEQLSALLELSSVGTSALEQARRLIAGGHGAIFISEGEALRAIAGFGDSMDAATPFLAAVFTRGVAAILNDVEQDSSGLVDGVRSVICVPLRAKTIVGVMVLANSTSDDAYSAADLKLLNTIALQTASAIENSILCAEMVGAVRDREQLASIQKELDTARTIQLSLIPRVFPPFPDRKDFELHAQMTAARSVGGDFFDFFLIDSENLGVVIGDVSGKGIPAALYMAVARTQIKTTALTGVTPEECLGEVNRGLMREKASSLYSTCFYGILNTRTLEFRYCNAGHNPPLVLRAQGLEHLNAEGGLPLGLFGGLPYSGAMVQLEPGDSVFLFTDGVSEANNLALDDFGDERLEKLVQSVAHLPCEELVHRVNEEVVAFVDGAPQSDDITMVSLRVRGI